MITLNSEKGLIRVEEWADIENRAGFSSDLDPSKHTLASIMGRYAFKDKLRCGLSNCHTPHTKGYIVTTQDGFETNIGKDCGRTYFGVDFDALSKKFDRDIEEKERRESLWSFSFAVEEIEQRIVDMRKGNRGADWVYKKSRPLVSMNQGCPAEIVRRLANMLKSGTDLVEISHEATEIEIELEETQTGRKLQRPHYVVQTIGNLNGIRALATENDLRDILVLDLESNLATFKSKNIDALTFEELKHWTKWSATIDERFEKADQSIKLGRALLVPDNLACLRNVLTTPEEKTEFSDYLQSLKL